MLAKSVIRLVVLLTLLPPAFAADVEAPEEEPRYPEARRGTQVDTYHGVEIADPYRWLEDLESPETHAFMKAQEALFASQVDSAEIERLADIISGLGETGATYTAPIHAAGSYFFMARTPREPYPIVYRRRGHNGKDTAMLKPGTFMAEDQRLGGFSVSPGARYLVFRTTTGGSRWGDLEVLDLASSKRLGRAIDGVANAGVVWTEDENGFFYIDSGHGERLKSGADEPRAAVRFHKIGSRPADDPVVFERPEQPASLFALAGSADHRFLTVAVFAGTGSKNQVFYVDLEAKDQDFSELLGDGEHLFTFLGNRNDLFYFYTNHSAPNGRVIVVDRKRSGVEHWREVIPERQEVLAGGSTAGGNAMKLVGDRLVLLYRRANLALVRVFDLEGQQRHEVHLAAGWIGSGIIGDDGAPGEAWYTFNGFLEPSTVYRLDLKSGETRPFIRPDLPIDPTDYVVEHVFYESRDKTRVPLFIAHKKGLEKNGENPVFMYGYGFGGWVAVPWYHPKLLTWLDMGGIYVMPGVRGGGEYGDAWRDAGERLHRQNAVDDYVAAAEWLVKERYTRPGKVVANGWSASGSLAAAALIERPDLFGAGLIGIPSLDMLRYHHFTAVPGWTRGYGSSDDPEEFRVLRAYSPYHNLREDRCYPPIFVTVGENDELTPPLHGYKFIAALQHKKNRSPACKTPALLKIARGAGHAFGKTPEDMRRTQAEELFFLAGIFGMELPSPADRSGAM